MRVSLAGPHRPGLHLPEGTVYVGRAYGGMKGHPLRNPHRVGAECKARLHCKFDPCTACAPCDLGGVVHTRDESLDLYRAHLLQHPDLIEMAAVLVEDRWSLACWCPREQACHIDVITEIGDLVVNDMLDAA